MNFIRFDCPGCGQNIEAEEAAQFVQVQCPTCHHEFIPDKIQRVPSQPAPKIVPKPTPKSITPPTDPRVLPDGFLRDEFLPRPKPMRSFQLHVESKAEIKANAENMTSEFKVWVQVILWSAGIVTAIVAIAFLQVSFFNSAGVTKLIVVIALVTVAASIWAVRLDQSKRKAIAGKIFEAVFTLIFTLIFIIAGMAIFLRIVTPNDYRLYKDTLIGWMDGQPYRAEVDSYLREHANDPSSVSIVSLSQPTKWSVVSLGQPTNGTGGNRVYCKFRAKNGFGALVLATWEFTLDANNNVVTGSSIEQ